MRASLVVLCLLAPAAGNGEPVPAPALQDAGAYPQKIKPFLTKHCVECHGPEKAKGKLRLDTLSPDFTADATRRKWLTVREQISSENMPPKAKPRPAQGDIDALIRWIDSNVVAVDLARQKTHGRAVLRRLNRVEYENTVRDLFSIQNDLQDLLPADTSAHGFDNVGEALHSSSFLMERYLEAADTALNAAIVNIPKPWQINKRFNIKEQGGIKLKGDVYRPLDDGAVAIFSSWISANICVTMWNFQARFPGKYRVKISGYGFQSDGRPVTFYVLTGTMKGVTEQRLVNYYDVPAGTPTVVEFSEHMEPGFTVRIVAEGLPVTPPSVTKVGADNYKGPGLALQWVEVEGPILENWPPPSHRAIFGDLPQAPVAGDKNRLEVVSTNPAADAERVLRTFARRAFRRAVTDDDLKPALARVKSRLAEGYTFEQAVRVGLKMVLVSPDFLFLRETPGKLDDFALASRLSYFLWSSMPDEELLTLAGERKLSQPDTLRKQVERLLQDPRAASFTRNFAGQWLSLRAIDDTMPDPTLYPEFKDALKESMAKEPVLFFDEVLKNDLSLSNFVASDFSMINGPLADFYGIPGVEGRDFRKVTLPAAAGAAAS